MKFNKAFYSNDVDMAVLAGVYNANVNIPVSSGLNIIGSIPFIYTSYERSFLGFKFDYSEQGLGNIFIGIQTNSQKVNNRKSVFSFGLSVPTASDKITASEYFSDYYNFRQFFNDAWGIYGNYAYHNLSPQGLVYSIEAGPDFILFEEKASKSDMEAFLHFGISAGYKFNKILVSSEFTGIMIVTEDVDNFTDRFVNQFSLGLQWLGKSFTPKLYYRLFVNDDLSDAIDGILGVGVTYRVQ